MTIKYIIKNAADQPLVFNFDRTEYRPVLCDALATLFDSATEAAAAIIASGVCGRWHQISVNEDVAKRSSGTVERRVNKPSKNTLHGNMRDQSPSTSGVRCPKTSEVGSNPKTGHAGENPAILTNLTDQELAVMSENA